MQVQNISEMQQISPKKQMFHTYKLNLNLTSP